MFKDPNDPLEKACKIAAGAFFLSMLCAPLMIVTGPVAFFLERKVVAKRNREAEERSAAYDALPQAEKDRLDAEYMKQSAARSGK